jgi:multiple sugar transport system permease protein
MAVIGDSTASRPARGPASRAPVRTAGPADRRPKPRGSLLPIFLVAPAVILLLLFTIAPAVYAVALSFLQVKVGGGLLGAGGTVEVFAGFANYISTLADPEFWAGLGRMLIVAVIGVPLTIFFSALFALCLDAKKARLVGVTRLAIFLPYAVPGVVASLLWGFMYLPATSPIGGDHVDFFGAVSVFFSVANIAVWGAVGFNMVVLYTALRALPPEIHEAARVDGCSELQIALRIKTPLVTPAIVMCTLFTVLAALQLFNEPNTLMPLSNAISSDWVPLMKVYTDAFVNSDIYQAAATSVLIAAAALVVSFIAARLVAARVAQEDA